MTCRTALLVNDRPQPQTARERLEVIDRLSESLLDAIARTASKDELALRVLDIQGHACIGAAYERRRERGEG